jgi:hypothetical protein
MSPERIIPRLSFNPAHSRRRAVDGGWWPQTRDAGTELPALITALDFFPGQRVSRLAVHADDWDDIPDRLPVVAGTPSGWTGSPPFPATRLA